MKQDQAIVVVGRNNSTKPSDTIFQIVQKLQDHGYTVHWFESDRSKASFRINARMHKVWPGLSGDPQALPTLRRVLRYAIKSILALIDVNRAAFIRAAFVSRPNMAAYELSSFLDQMPHRAADLIAHSAGGIAATKVSANAKIGRIICFGYPFQHPERGPEAYRTSHLSSVRKPLLILQGTADTYGREPAHFSALLPSSSTVTMLECDHNYSALKPTDFDRAWATVSDFVGLRAPA